MEIKPESAVVVVADNAWASLGAVRIFLGRDKEMNALADQLGGMIIAGKLLDAEDIHGLTIEVEAELLKFRLKHWRIFIPWQYVIALFSHPNWPISKMEQQIGFAVASQTRKQAPK